MNEKTIRRLGAADPAASTNLEPDEGLLARTMALPREPVAGLDARSRPRLALPAAMALLAAVAAGAAGLLASADRTSGPTVSTTGPERHRPLSLALAAQAYAKTTPASGQIIYSRVRVTSRLRMSTGIERQGVTVEEWHRGRETHRLERYDTAATQSATALDHIIGRDGVMRQIDNLGRYRIVRPSDNADAAQVIAHQQAGFVADFRASYRGGRLDATADVEFHGRPARRYVVERPTSPGLPRTEQAFYIDRETSQPLGSTLTASAPRPAGSTPPGAIWSTSTQIVQSIRLLAPTPGNLKHLRAFTLPRRRDADGCIRDPLIHGRSRDAPKRDCGGVPHAPVP